MAQGTLTENDKGVDVSFSTGLSRRGLYYAIATIGAGLVLLALGYWYGILPIVIAIANQIEAYMSGKNSLDQAIIATLMSERPSQIARRY